jgi:hypothetical protein
LKDGELVELEGGFLEFFVLEELVDEFPAGVNFVLGGVGIDGGLTAWEQHAALNFHQCGCHHEKLTGDVEVELAQGMEDVDVLAGDGDYRNIVDIDLVFLDEEKKEIEGSLKDRELDAIIGVWNHSREMLGGGGRAAMKNLG